MTVTETLAARVEALCGDLSRVRAPRGTDLNALVGRRFMLGDVAMT